MLASNVQSSYSVYRVGTSYEIAFYTWQPSTVDSNAAFKKCSYLLVHHFLVKGHYFRVHYLFKDSLGLDNL